jgi:hypothetical protein
VALPTLVRGLRVVVEPYNPKCSFLFKKIATLAVPRGPCLRNPLSTTVEASSMAPAVLHAVPDRRFGATGAPGPRRVAIYRDLPTGGR